MGLCNSEGKEICCSPKRVKTSDDYKNFISDLPDEILVHILSFLPIKDAINTVLLRRFGDLWRSIRVLDFDSCFYHDCEDDEYIPDYLNESFVDVIRHVMNLHVSSTLDKLCLQFGFALTHSKGFLRSDIDYLLEWEKGTSEQIEMLIRYAIIKKVKILDLNLKGCKSAFPDEFYDLPDVLSSNYLTDLKLSAFDITSCTTVDLKSLRVLLLDEVSLSDNILENIFLGCPSLENLSLVFCYGFGKIYCQNPKLEKLMLVLNPLEDGPVIISCPYVLSLEISGWIERASLLDVSSVVDASIHFLSMFKCKQKPYDAVRLLLQKFSQCNTFRPCVWTILVLTIWSFTNMPCPSFGWKNLILNLGLTKWHHPGLSLLWRNSQSLETLTMDIHPCSSDVFKVNKEKWIEAYEFDRENYWDSLEAASFPCLGTIMIRGYVNTPSMIQMIQFLLQSAPRLQKLVISNEESLNPARESIPGSNEQLQELSRKLKSLPRASPEATIYIS